MKSPENPLAVANFFIQKGIDSGRLLTPMQVVKLAYISHGWSLGLSGEPLFSEPVQAWKYGPVIPSIYQNLKTYGNGEVSNILLDVAATGYGYEEPKIINERTNGLLDKIWNVYGSMDGLQLSTLTHKVGTPWYIVWELQNGKKLHGVPIPNILIENHYKQKATTTVNV